MRETKIKTLEIQVGQGIAHTHNPTTWEAGIKGMSQIQSYPGYITSTRAARDTWERRKKGRHKPIFGLNLNRSHFLKNCVIRRYSNPKIIFLHQTTKK